MFLFLLAVFSVILLVYKYRKSHDEFLPGPKGLPIIGNLHQYANSNTHSYLSNLGKHYGSIFMLRLMNQSMVVIQSAKLAKEVLKKQDKNFCDRNIPTGRKRLSYNGLDIAFSPYSDYTREMKKIVSAYLFSSKKIESYSHIRNEEVSRLIEKVSSLASSSQVLNLSELILCYASSNSGRITFGKRYGDEVVGRRYSSLVQEAEEMFTSFFFTDYFPMGSWLDMLTGRSSRLDKVFNNLDRIYEKIINDHICSENPKSEEHESIVHIMLRLMKDDSFPFKLTMNHIKAVLMNLFMGGANATTVGAIWAIVELVRNPLAMKKVQQELRNVAQDKGFVQESHLSKLIYFKAVVKETFRLHPPAPLLIPREAINKTSLGGYTILPKTVININAWKVGRDPEYWKDPEVFMPERFIDPKNETDTDEMFPFGGGRRMCPGSSLGLANLELALANLLYAFEWELPPGLNKEDIDNNVLPGIVTYRTAQLCLVAKKC